MFYMNRRETLFKKTNLESLDRKPVISCILIGILLGFIVSSPIYDASSIVRSNETDIVPFDKKRRGQLVKRYDLGWNISKGWQWDEQVSGNFWSISSFLGANFEAGIHLPVDVIFTYPRIAPLKSEVESRVRVEGETGGAFFNLLAKAKLEAQLCGVEVFEKSWGLPTIAKQLSFTTPIGNDTNNLLKPRKRILNINLPQAVSFSLDVLGYPNDYLRAYIGVKTRVITSSVLHATLNATGTGLQHPVAKNVSWTSPKETKTLPYTTAATHGTNVTFEATNLDLQLEQLTVILQEIYLKVTLESSEYEEDYVLYQFSVDLPDSLQFTSTFNSTSTKLGTSSPSIVSEGVRADASNSEQRLGNPNITHSVQDLTSPKLQISSPKEDQEIGEPWKNTFTTTWSGHDPSPGTGIHHYEVQLDNRIWQDVGKATKYTFHNVNDGEHTIRIKAIDNAGNVEKREITFTLNNSLLLPSMIDDILLFAGISIIIAVFSIPIIKKHQ